MAVGKNWELFDPFGMIVRELEKQLEEADGLRESPHAGNDE